MGGTGDGSPSTGCVALVVPVLDFGGVESRTVIQAAGMADRRVDLRVCCFADAGQAAADVRKLGVPVDVLNTRPSPRNPVATYRLWRYLRSHRPVIVHGITGAMTVHSLIAAALAGVSTRIVEEVGIPRRRRLGRMLFPWLYRLATCVIAVSDSVASYLVERDGVPDRKVRRIYNAVDGRYFEVQREPRDGRFRILAVGRLVPVKGYDVLLRAVAPLMGEDDGLILSLVGAGPERTRLERLVEELGIERSVSFLGYRRDVPELLAAADVLVLPSRSEGMGLALVEAMATATPVIATRVGGVPEVVPEWATRWLVTPDDVDGLRAALERMRRSSSEDRDALGTRLRDHVRRHFAPDVYVAALESLYDELIARTARAAR